MKDFRHRVLEVIKVRRRREKLKLAGFYKIRLKKNKNARFLKWDSIKEKDFKLFEACFVGRLSVIEEILESAHKIDANLKRDRRKVSEELEQLVIDLAGNVHFVGFDHKQPEKELKKEKKAKTKK